MIKPQMRKTATLLSLMIAISILSVCCRQLTTTSASEAESATPINSRDYCPAIHALIKNAKSNIRIMAYQTFFYTDFPDSDSNLFIKNLAKRAREACRFGFCSKHPIGMKTSKRRTKNMEKDLKPKA